MFTTVVQGISGFIAKLPNLEKLFPTEESRYNAYVKLLYFTLIVKFLSKVLEVVGKSLGRSQDPSIFTSLVVIVASLAVFAATIGLLYVGLYITVKSGVLEYVLKLLLGLIVSSLICGFLSLILGPLAPIIAVIAAIFANRRRFAVIKKYKSYVYYSIGMIAISSICAIITIIGLFIAGATRGRSAFEPVLILVALICGIGVFAAPIVIMHYALKKEMGKGTPFLQVIKLMNVMPLTLLFICFSSMTLTHLNYFSGDSVFGGVDGDPLGFGDSAVAHAAADADVSGVHSMDMGATDNTFVLAPDDFAGSPVATSHPIGMDATPVTHTDTSVMRADASSIQENVSQSVQDVSQPDSATLYDNNGLAHETIKQTGDNHYVIQDNMGHMTGQAYTDPVTGKATIHTQDFSASITSDGTIHNDMGLQNGNVKTMYNGDQIIQDAQGQNIGKIKADGTILDSKNMSNGKFK